MPARDKFATPGYQYLLAHEIPTAESPDGKVHVTVIAGEAFGVRAAIGTHTPIWLQELQVQTGAETTIPSDATFNAAAYVFNGTVAFGPQSKEVQQGQMAVFGPGDLCRSPAGAGRPLLTAGRRAHRRAGRLAWAVRDE